MGSFSISSTFAAACEAAATEGRPARIDFSAAAPLAAVPDPGYPEGVAVDGGRMYVSGPAAFDNTGPAPSPVFVFDVRDGRLLDRIPIQGQDTSRPHSLSCVALDAGGRLYVLDEQQGVIRVDPRTGAQERYAPLPDVPGAGYLDAASAFGPPPRPPLLNDLAFDREGNLFITDSMNGVIYRVPPGGGAMVRWFHDARLEMFFGPNGCRIHPRRDELYFVTTIEGSPLTGEFRGRLWRLPLGVEPRAEDLEMLYDFGNAGPDGIAFGATGDLYVALAFANQIALLSTERGLPDGRRAGIRLVASGPHPGVNQQLPLPLDAPANLAFDGKGDLLVTNHALHLAGPPPDPSVFAVLRVPVGDPGARLERPKLP